MRYNVCSNVGRTFGLERVIGIKYSENENISKTKGTILEVSEQLFAEKGFDKTGVNEIAERAGIAKSVIYHHFKNKNEILQILVQNLSAELVELKQTIKDMWPGQLDNAVEATLEELLVFWEAHQRMAAIILTESLKDSNEIPLFTLWDHNINRPMDTLNQNTNLTPDEIMRIIEGTFFMMFLPTYSFAILEGKWCQHYHADSAEVRQTFLTLMAETCKNKIYQKR